MSDILVSKVMLDAIRANVIREGSFFRDVFFANANTVETTQPVAEWDVINSDPVKLPFVGYDGESSSEVFGGFVTKTAKFDCIRHGHTITPSVLKDRLPGLTEYDDADKIARLQDLSLARLDRLVRMQEETMAIEALTKGKVSVTRENGQVITLAQYWNTPETGDGANDPIITATTAWTTQNAKQVVSDVMGWVNKMTKEGGTNPRIMVVAADVAMALVAAFVDTPYSVFNPGQVSLSQPYDSEGIRWIANINGIDVYQCPTAVGGVELLPSGSAILGSGGDNVMMYGPTYLPSGDGQGMFSAVSGRRTFYTRLSSDPIAIKNVIQSAPLPIVRRKWDNLYIKGLTSGE